MVENPIITLTTDYGTLDGYVGVLKGLILSLNPRANILDITHDISAQDILGAAFTLCRACPAFPKGTIHVAVVDPGVGGERRPLLLRTESSFFIGPDNGIFSLVVDREDEIHIIELKESKYFLTPVSDTFHGRDIFAPVAAYLSLGVDPTEFGPRVEEYVNISIPQPLVSKGEIIGQVLHIDHFGNVMINIDRQLYRDTVGNQAVSINIGPHTLDTVSRSYSDVEEGSPLAILGSSGFLEISVNRGNAQQYFQLRRGDPIRLRMS